MITRAYVNRQREQRVNVQKIHINKKLYVKIEVGLWRN